MVDSHSLRILMEILQWPCALFNIQYFDIFSTSLVKISRVSFGVSSNGKLAFSLKSVAKVLLTNDSGIRGIFLLLQKVFKQSSEILHLCWNHLIVCPSSNSTHPYSFQLIKRPQLQPLSITQSLHFFAISHNFCTYYFSL